MGTRADFYIGRGLKAKWMGSLVCDGYPSGIKPQEEMVLCRCCGHINSARVAWKSGHLFDSKTEQEFRERLKELFVDNKTAVLRRYGWSWPYDDSRHTDWSYWFDAGRVWALRISSPFWFSVGTRSRRHGVEEGADALRYPVDKLTPIIYPDMSGLRR